MGLALRKPRPESYFDIHLHAKQAIAFDTPATEVLYGGAAGGGKSHLMRSAAISWAMSIPGLQIYLFRRVYRDLIKNHLEGPKGFRSMLAGLVQAGHCRIVEEEIQFANGSKIYLCHCQHEKDVYKYQGAEIHVLLIDELTHWLEGMYRFLRNRVRMVGLKDRLPPEYKDRFPRILCSANPGNVGHLWVKETFVNQGPLAIVEQPDEEGGMLRQYIPARLDDNPSLTVDDPGYEKRLGGLGSAALVKAMKDGDWDVVEGAFFDEWSNKRHVVKPFAVPNDWTRFIAVDWGSSHPFSVGWYAVVGDDFNIPGTNYHMPRGSLLRYREWYGIATDKVTGKAKANVGVKLTAKQLALGIKARSIPDTSEGIKYAYVVLDPSMFAQDGGPSKAETMMKAGIRNLRPGDNKRTPKGGAEGGWDQMRARLRGEGWTEDGPGPEWTPAFFVFESCTHFVRTVPVLQHDPDRPEDVDTDGEDHAGDEGRYACMSRPYARRPVEDKPKVEELTYTAVQNPDGTVSVTSNIGIRKLVEERNRKAAKKRGR